MRGKGRWLCVVRQRQESRDLLDRGTLKLVLKGTRNIQEYDFQSEGTAV